MQKHMIGIHLNGDERAGLLPTNNAPTVTAQAGKVTHVDGS